VKTKFVKMKTRPGIILIIVVSAFGLTHCFESENLTPEQRLERDVSSVNKTQLEIDLAIIDDSLTMWGVTPIIGPHKMRYTVEQLGTGPKPTLSSVISVKYKGTFLTTGDIFGEHDHLVYNLSQLILGWKIVLPLLPVGSKATLYIPSGYAYGPQPIVNDQGTVIVPADSNMVFEIELLDTN
jgi:FKBP-type peptidyl-prolyl cis-trans isomerase FkpA